MDTSKADTIHIPTFLFVLLFIYMHQSSSVCFNSRFYVFMWYKRLARFIMKQELLDSGKALFQH